MVDHSVEDKATAIARAGSIWAERYGLVRTRTGQHLATGQTRASRHNSEAEFIRKRRRTVRQHSNLEPELKNEDLTRLVSTTWTDAMAKEARFQKNKRHIRLAEALDEKWVDATHPETQTPDFQAFKAWDETQERRRECDRKRAARRRAEAWKCPRMSDINIRGAGVCFVTQAAKDECHAACRMVGLVESDNMWGAKIFVARAADDLSIEFQLRLSLAGGVLMLSSFVNGQGRRSNGMLEYTSATRTARTIWCSANFADEHPGLHQCVYQAVTSDGSKWRILEGTVDDFFHLRGRRPNLQVLAVVTDEEKQTDVSPSMLHSQLS